MYLKKVRQHPSWQEFQQNKRLQWLLVVVVLIVLLSTFKSASDAVAALQRSVAAQQTVLARLQAASARPLSIEDVDEWVQKTNRLKASAPQVPSASIAEAQALAMLEALNKRLLRRGRATLIGTETLDWEQNRLWQVRLELSGQLDSSDWVSFLQTVDGSNAFVRLASLQYRPKASNAITVVIDYLFLQEETS